MFTRHTPGTALTVVFDVEASYPAVGDDTQVRWRALDEANIERASWTDAVLSDDKKTVTVEVPASSTALIAPGVRGLLSITLELSGTTFGPLPGTITTTYLLQGETALVFGVNTFLTYGQAQLLAMDFNGDMVEGWLGNEDKGDRESALIEAYGRICRLPLRVEIEKDTQNVVRSIDNLPSRLLDYKPEQVKQIYPLMLTALRSAQLVEASDILRADPMLRARMDGMVSMTVGESSQFFGAAKALNLGANSRSVGFLGRWIRYTARIGRA